MTNSRSRITGAMLRKTEKPAAAEPEVQNVAPAPTARRDEGEATASHPLFVAPQFGYRRAPSSGVAVRPQHARKLVSE